PCYGAAAVYMKLKRYQLTHYLLFLAPTSFLAFLSICCVWLLAFFSCQCLVCQSLVKNATHREIKSFAIVPKTLVKPEALFIKVAEHMKRLDRNIGAFDTALQ